MNPWLVKISVIVTCMALKLIGELWQHNAQRFVLPIIYSLAVSVQSHCLWLGLTTFPMIGALLMGYKVYGSNSAVDRALWLFVICVIAGLGPTVTGHLDWWVYLPYIITAGFVGTLTRNINNLIGAPINGLWISLPILFIHI